MYILPHPVSILYTYKIMIELYVIHRTGYYNYTVLQNTYNILDQYKILEHSTFGPKLVSKYVYFVMVLFVMYDY